MKTTIKIFLVLALALVVMGANAADPVPTRETQAVIKGSVHRYVATEANKGTSEYLWNITGATLGTDYEIWKSYADKDNFATGEDAYVATSVNGGDAGYVEGKYILYVKWKTEGVRVVSFIERNKDSDCSDDTNNVRFCDVTVSGNSFEFESYWDLKANGKTSTCAINGENTLKFYVTKNGGKDDDWYFKYEAYYKNIGAGETVWTKFINETKVDATKTQDDDTSASATGLQRAVDISTAVPTGIGNYLVKIIITDARDGYNTLANKVELYTLNKTEANEVFATATIKKVPTSADKIITD